MLLHDLLEFRARVSPDAPFATMGSHTLSFREADRRANQLAHALAGAGLEKGDRFAILAKNCIEYALLYYAASKAGVVPVPMNYRLAPPEWAYILGDAGARLVLARGGLADALATVRNDLPGVERYVGLETDAAGFEPFEDFVAGQPQTRPDRNVSPEDDLYQMYTSGTTGRPKGAVITHRALCSNLHQVLLNFGGEPGERALIVAPLYHAAAGIITFCTVQSGGCLYIQEDFDPAEVVRALAEERIAIALLVPAMIQFCLVAVPDAGERKYPALRLVVYGASPIAEETLRQAIDVFDCGFLQGYGMTELSAVASNLLPEDHRLALSGRPDLLLSAGRPVAGTEIRIVDEEDNRLPSGQIGEVIVRGPQVMRGYWNLPDATTEALRNGWMHTGDAGILDDDGYLFIQDRVKDMIVSGGENVYPREIEEVLYGFPAVAEAAVFGVPDARFGEAVKAAVVLREGASATADDIIDYCRGKLAGFKRPTSVDFVDALPRNPTGKVLKKDLREPYWKGHTRRVGG